MPPIKLAFLGAGDVAQRDYLPEIGRLAGRVELVAVCGRGSARAEAVATRYGFRAVYADYRRMLAECDADAVVNLSPIQLHDETNEAILASGRHLYTEKPAASSLAAARRLEELARARGLVVVCAPCVLRFPQVVLARQLLQQGAIGPVYLARGLGYGGVPPWGGYPSDPSPFFATGGGPQRDMGVYPLHAITGLLGAARRVSAMAAQAQRSFVVPDGPLQGATVPIEEPDNWLITLDLGEGRLAAVEANNIANATHAPQLELLGLRGTLAVNLLDVSAPLELRRDGRWEQIEVPSSGRSSGPDHLLGVEHLVECIARGEPPELSLGHAAHVIEILDLAARSAAEGGAYTLS
jgi:predicted dehydrogenase